MPTLTISPTPYRSSHLTIPPTPFTPRLPISPPPRPQVKSSNSNTKIALSVPPPPQEPLKWLWQCHCCSRIYHLGTTRRCLDDGHYFCAGAPVTKRDRKTGLRVTRKSRACASEFDYQGWKTWGSWRRDVDEQRAVAEALQIEDVHVEPQPSDVVPRPLFAPAVPQEGRWFNGAWTRKPTVAEAAPTPVDFWATAGTRATTRASAAGASSSASSRRALSLARSRRRARLLPPRLRRRLRWLMSMRRETSDSQAALSKAFRQCLRL
jgi:hypothetical protein